MSEVTELSLTEVANYSQGGDLWVCIRGHVYDVSKFIEEHPGGEEVLRAFAGKDATEAFEDAAHSEEVKPIMDGLLVGRVPSLQQPNGTYRTQRLAGVVSPQMFALKTRQSHVVRKDAGNQTKIYLGLLFIAIVAVTLIMAAPGFAFFVVFGTTIPLALLVYGFMAVTSHHRGAEDYADYIKSSLTG